MSTPFFQDLTRTVSSWVQDRKVWAFKLLREAQKTFADAGRRGWYEDKIQHASSSSSAKILQQRGPWLLQLASWQRDEILLAAASRVAAVAGTGEALVSDTDIGWCCSCSRYCPDSADLHLTWHSSKQISHKNIVSVLKWLLHGPQHNNLCYQAPLVQYRQAT